jgi:hypothetical protein
MIHNIYSFFDFLCKFNNLPTFDWQKAESFPDIGNTARKTKILYIETAELIMFSHTMIRSGEFGIEAHLDKIVEIHRIHSLPEDTFQYGVIFQKRTYDFILHSLLPSMQFVIISVLALFATEFFVIATVIDDVAAFKASGFIFFVFNRVHGVRLTFTDKIPNTSYKRQEILKYIALIMRLLKNQEFQSGCRCLNKKIII